MTPHTPTPQDISSIADQIAAILEKHHVPISYPLGYDLMELIFAQRKEAMEKMSTAIMSVHKS